VGALIILPRNISNKNQNNVTTFISDMKKIALYFVLTLLHSNKFWFRNSSPFAILANIANNSLFTNGDKVPLEEL